MLQGSIGTDAWVDFFKQDISRWDGFVSGEECVHQIFLIFNLERRKLKNFIKLK